MNQPTEAELPAITAELDTAVDSLCGARTYRDGTEVYFGQSLLTELQQALHDQSRYPGTGSRAWESQPPMWIAGFDMLREVETRVQEWRTELGLERGDMHSTIRGLPDRHWTPAEVKLVHWIGSVISGWAARIASLMDDSATQKDVRGWPCPAILSDGESCGIERVKRHENGDDVWKTALVMDLAHDSMGDARVTGVHCRACGTFWPEHHVRLLGLSILADAS